MIIDFSVFRNKELPEYLNGLFIGRGFCDLLQEHCVRPACRRSRFAGGREPFGPERLDLNSSTGLKAEGLMG